MIVQITPNAQLGGVHLGFRKFWYQGPTSVALRPKTPKITRATPVIKKGTHICIYLLNAVNVKTTATLHYPIHCLQENPYRR